MIVTLNKDIGTRLNSWCRFTKQPPEILVNAAIEQSLDDWEDYNDALRICAEVDSGKMRTYSLAEVEEHLNALEG